MTFRPTKLNTPLSARYLPDDLIECGCDEAGRGALAGDLYAAAVIWPEDVDHPNLCDSKLLSCAQRSELRHFIESHAIAYAVGSVSVEEIGKINILGAAMLGMHRAINSLSLVPQRLLIDGNYYTPRPDEVEYHCIVKGDNRYRAIAAASILAKTYRDEYMCRLSEQCSLYDWHKNKGYPTAHHRAMIAQYGASKWHRGGFRLLPQPTLFDTIE